MIALVLKIKTKETKHCITPYMLEEQTQKVAVANTKKSTLGFICLYDLWPGNRAGPILTTTQPAQGTGKSKLLQIKTNKSTPDEN